MYPFVESICVKNGEIRNIEAHNLRCNNTRNQYFKSNIIIDLKEQIPVDKINSTQIHKVRVEYLETIEKVEIIPYKIKTINTISLVEANNTKYNYKSTNRQFFKELVENAKTDEVIIIQNQHITDTSYSNLVFFDGKNWITPSTYLLNGTMRQYLLAQKQIIEQPIRIKDLADFKSFKLINAMMNLEESPMLNIKMIQF